MIAEILIPPIMKIGGGALNDVPAILARLNCARPMIVTDPFLMSRGLPGELQERIGKSCGIFSETVADPTSEVVDAGVRAYVEGGYDSLISLGGGSPIDTA